MRCGSMMFGAVDCACAAVVFVYLSLGNSSSPAFHKLVVSKNRVELTPPFYPLRFSPEHRTRLGTPSPRLRPSMIIHEFLLSTGTPLQVVAVSVHIHRGVRRNELESVVFELRNCLLQYHPSSGSVRISPQFQTKKVLSWSRHYVVHKSQPIHGKTRPNVMLPLTTSTSREDEG